MSAAVQVALDQVALTAGLGKIVAARSRDRFMTAAGILLRAPLANWISDLAGSNAIAIAVARIWAASDGKPQRRASFSLRGIPTK